MSEFYARYNSDTILIRTQSCSYFRTWLYNIARGIDHDPVTKRLVSKSIGCCKNFPGRQALTTRMDVRVTDHIQTVDV
jgi:nucleotidyltransferase/DNA polymerase involved in DNA repair